MSRKLNTVWHLFLYIGLAFGFLAVYLARFNPGKQFIILMLLVLFYLVWGFAYHHIKGEADRRIFLEYLFIGLIAVMAGFLVLVN